MSFSKETKSELCSAPVFTNEYKIAEVYGMVLFARTFSMNDISFSTESRAAAGAFSQMLSSLTETIVDMNVEGMPWYVRGRYKNPGIQESGKTPEPLTKEQMRAYKWAAVRAGLLIIAVFGLAFFLFIAFCDFIWFR